MLDLACVWVRAVLFEAFIAALCPLALTQDKATGADDWLSPINAYLFGYVCHGSTSQSSARTSVCDASQGTTFPCTVFMAR